ncbi:uncharacterized protein METZ01_LOCUS121768 [marine metagenome]|uniref:Uncharacterized protein n=1 Tax=marine metagenome TaxID=408172 RepID=A0A381XVV5_9ZZZZ|tara:strand:- start:291 stop:671 length:381 start_codon:yes stop_codon:yes gene_type:complete
MKRTTSAEDKAAAKLIAELEKYGLLVKAYDPQFKKDIVMITSKGVKVKDFLNAFTELDKGKKDNKDGTKFTMKNVNKAMLKFMSGMEAVSKMAQKYDKDTGGAPKADKSLFTPKFGGGHEKTKNQW